MSSSNVQRRRIVGLTLVVLVYLGGLIVWSWAVRTVDSDPSGPDSTTATIHHASPPSTLVFSQMAQEREVTASNEDRRGAR